MNDIKHIFIAFLMIALFGLVFGTLVWSTQSGCGEERPTHHGRPVWCRP
jgi:hypothetical protein